ncbi:hypothetical protein ACLK19_18005 [Escherichia coli]
MERCTPSGFQFSLGQHRYPVTAVGSVAEDNLRNWVMSAWVSMV